MRFARRGAYALLVLAMLTGCGSDSNEPEDPFPDASAVYEVTGGFDDFSSSQASFTGTLELTQASRESGALEGTAALLADLDGDIFSLTDDDLASATVSPSGVVTFTMAGGSTTWTFSGRFLATTSAREGTRSLGVEATISRVPGKPPEARAAGLQRRQSDGRVRSLRCWPGSADDAPGQMFYRCVTFAMGAHPPKEGVVFRGVARNHNAVSWFESHPLLLTSGGCEPVVIPTAAGSLITVTAIGKS